MFYYPIQQLSWSLWLVYLMLFFYYLFHTMKIILIGYNADIFIALLILNCYFGETQNNIQVFSVRFQLTFFI